MSALIITDEELLVSTRPTKAYPTYTVHAVYADGRTVTFHLWSGERAYRQWASEYGARILGVELVSVHRAPKEDA